MEAWNPSCLCSQFFLPILFHRGSATVCCPREKFKVGQTIFHKTSSQIPPLGQLEDTRPSSPGYATRWGSAKTVWCARLWVMFGFSSLLSLPPQQSRPRWICLLDIHRQLICRLSTGDALSPKSALDVTSCHQFTRKKASTKGRGWFLGEIPQSAGKTK